MVNTYLVGLGWRIYRRLQNRLPATGEYGASWASRHDLRDLAVRRGSDLTGLIVLGRTRWRQTIASPLRHSLLLFGPTLSGKTLSFVTPHGAGAARHEQRPVTHRPERHRAGRQKLDP